MVISKAKRSDKASPDIWKVKQGVIYVSDYDGICGRSDKYLLEKM